MSLNRGGVTLVELLVALVLLALVGGSLTRLTLQQRRSGSSLLAGDDDRRTVEQAAGWMTAELTGVGKGDSSSDLLRIAGDSLTYRAWRMYGLACLVTASEVRVRVDQATMWRSPQPGRDSLSIYLTVDSMLEGGRWVTAPIEGVGESDCSGRPALRFDTQLDPTRLAGLPPLSPIRSFEVMQMRFYRSAGEWWLGARSVSAGEGIQPLAGPFPGGGVRVAYRDSTGVETSQPESVERMQLSLTPAGYLDSARVFLAPRNLP